MQDKTNKIEISALDTQLNPPQSEGWQIAKAPQAALTAADPNQATGTYSTGTADIINNLQTRLNELEARLQNLNLIK